MDEAYYTVVSTLEGYHYECTGEINSWPVLSHLVNRVGGIVGVRLITAAFGIITVLLVCSKRLAIPLDGS